jgi:hypothetical protein
MLLLLLLLLGEGREIEAMSWIQAASKLAKDLASTNEKTLTDAGYGSTAEVVSRFASARKTTTNTVRRQLAATAFLESVLPPEKFQSLLQDETPPPFNTIEVLKKLHAVDPALGQSLLPKALARTVTFAQMTEKYQTALANTPHADKRLSIRRQSSIEFEKEVLEALIRSPSSLYPANSKVNISPLQRSISTFVFALPDALATFDDEQAKRRYDSIEIKMPTDGARHQVWQILERIQLMSTFFTHTWLILPFPVLPEQISFTDTLVKAKATLGLPSVGIVTAALGETVEFNTLVEPTGLPEIDRRHLLPRL